MLLQLKRHDGAVEEIESVSGSFARQVATSFDWDAEYRRFEQLAESGAESFFPSIAFTDDAGRTLEFGPNGAEHFWLVYRYSTLKSSFGFCPVDQECQQHLEACALDVALDLMDRHYRGEHHDIVSTLPAQDCEEDEGD